MSDPNTVLSAWQMTIMAVVPLLALAGWLIVIFIVAREPRQRAAATTLAGATSAATGAVTSAGQDEPTEPAGRRLAA